MTKNVIQITCLAILYLEAFNKEMFPLIQTLTADVKMLSGTAIGIYLASAPTEHTSIRTFWTVFSNVFQGSTVLSLLIQILENKNFFVST